MQNPPPDLVRTTLGVLFIGALIAAAFWILRPFIGATIWATMLVVATWPVMKWFEARLWGRRSLAVLVMTLLMLMLFMVPLMVAIATIVSHLDDIVSQAKTFAAAQIPHPPQWVGSLPFVGEKIVQVWEQAIPADPRAWSPGSTPYADDIAKWFVSQAGSVGSIFLQFLLTVIVSALMYAGGESAALAVHRFGRRLAGIAGDNVVTLAGQAIRAVALGVGVTALVQSGLGGIALAIAGVPFAGLLAAVMLLLCIAQLGPGLVMFPAVAWLYWSDQTGWGTFLLVCSHRGRHDGQLPAAGADQARRRSSDSSDLRRRDRRPAGLWPGGHLCRAGHAGRGLHPARFLGGRWHSVPPSPGRQLKLWRASTTPAGA